MVSSAAQVVSQSSLPRSAPVVRRRAVLAKKPEAVEPPAAAPEVPASTPSIADLTATSPALFAAEMLSGPAEAPYHGRFLLGPHHCDWDALVTSCERVCVLAPRDHGKCGLADDLIATPSGVRMRLGDWAGGWLWAFDIQNQRFRPAYAPAARPNGLRSVVTVRTRSGRTETVTENHPFLGFDRWIPASELVVGQRIAVAYRLRIASEVEVADGWVLGLLVGDGGLTGSSVNVTTADPAIIAALRLLGISVGHTPEKDCYTYRLHRWQKRLREVGLWGKDAHEKRVPNCIFSASDKSVAEFLAGYFDSDGSVNALGGGSLEFYSVSEGLLRDVQYLLVRLGILSVLSPKKGKYNGQAHWSWRLTIRGKDVARFAELVFLRGAKKDALVQVAKTQSDKAPCSGDALDRFPAQVFDFVEHSEDWFRRNGFVRPVRQYEPTREKVARLAAAEQNNFLQQYADSDVFWDEVVEIEPAGEQETWALHVPGFENYLANDLVNHNTYYFDFAVPLWKIATQPGGSGYIFSATREQAHRILEDIKTEIETNPKLRWLIPARKTRWSGHSIRLSNGHTVYARGYQSKIRGAHPNWIIVDDALNDETAYSELTRRKQIEYFYSAVTNMVRPGGQIIVVGTPFHQSDLYGDLRKNLAYTFRRYQALSVTGAPLWPLRYDKTRLEQRRQEIGAIRFSREFQCDPVSDDLSLFPGALFVGQPTEQHTISLGMPLERWQELGISIYMSVDIALSASSGADYFVAWVMGVDKRANRWIVDIVRQNGVSFQEQLSIIARLARKYEVNLLYIESNQMQQVWGDELIRLTDLPVKKFVTTARGKHALDKGVPGMRVLLENGKFRIPRGDRRSVELTDAWIAEMRAIIWDGEVRSVGEHDDTVMACWICDQAIRQGGFSFSFGADGEDDGTEVDEVGNLVEDDDDMGGSLIGDIGHAANENGHSADNDDEIEDSIFG
jgi:hypothetical protein